MKRHALGLVGFVGSVLVSFALVLPFAPSWHRSAPAPRSGQTYAVDRVSNACGLDDAERCVAYASSDGAQLFFMTHEYGSPQAARTAFGLLRAQAGPGVLAREVGAVEHTFLIFAADKVVGAHTTYASVWVDGSHLVGIYGPSPRHVLELEDANPDRLW